MEQFRPEQPLQIQSNKTLEEIRDYEKKNYRLNRIRALCSVAALVLCIAVAVFLYANVNTLMGKAAQITQTVSDAGDNFNAVAEDLQKIDFETLGKSLQEIADISKDTVQQANETASDLDKIVKTADTALENIAGLRIEALNDGIRELNAVLENIKKFFDKLPF